MLAMNKRGHTKELYEQWARRQGRSAATIRCQGSVIALAERELGCALADADPGAVADWIASRRTSETRRVYSCALRAAVKAGAAPESVLAEVGAFRRPRHLPRPVPDDIVDRLLDLPDPIDRVCVLLAAFAGLRRSEIPTVEPGDLVRLGSGWRVRVVGKGGVERLAPIPAWVVDEVISWLPVRRAPHTIGYRIGDAIKAAGGTGGIHGLRHAYASSLLRSCHDLRIVQDALGHASPATTAVYTLVDTDAATTAVEQMRRPRLRPVA